MFLGAYFEPQDSLRRIILAKITMIVVVVALADYNHPDEYYTNRSAIRLPEIQKQNFELKHQYYTLMSQIPYSGLLQAPTTCELLHEFVAQACEGRYGPGGEIDVPLQGRSSMMDRNNNLIFGEHKVHLWSSSML
ncbi:unnamed protein product [Brassica oleracea]